MLTPTESSPDAEIFDAAAIAAELARLSEVHSGNERELRLAASRHLRGARGGGDEVGEEFFLAPPHQRRCF